MKESAGVSRDALAMAKQALHDSVRETHLWRPRRKKFTQKTSRSKEGPTPRAKQNSLTTQATIPCQD